LDLKMEAIARGYTKLESNSMAFNFQDRNVLRMITRKRRNKQNAQLTHAD